MANQPISAVVFDFGGVLSSSPRAMMQAKAVEAGITLEEMMPIILGPLGGDGDHPWHKTERGELTIAEFVVAIEPQWRALGHTSFPTPPTATEMLAELGPETAMLDAARTARAAGFTTGILTNNVREWSSWRDIVEADTLVDVVIDSCEVGLRKPNPAIYSLMLELVGVPAEACLFLDDFPWNLEPAAAMGIQTMLVEDPVESARMLLERLDLT